MVDTRDPIATQRASMPTGTHAVLDRRTLERDNKNLLPLLRKGLTVMDVGCGSGAITIGIAEKVGDGGRVVGIDTSAELISLAIEKYSAFPQLSFLRVNVMDFETDLQFDVITAARTLQWMNDPKKALLKMKNCLKNDGCISVLDYNHEKIEWQPTPPRSMVRFYAAFLNWRQEAGMDNQIADQLEMMFSEVGLKRISVTDQSESSCKENPDFLETAGIWRKVAETRGHQLVSDGYVTEKERIAAIDEYGQWLHNEGASMKMYLMATTGYNQ